MRKILTFLLLLLLRSNAQSDLRCSPVSGNLYQLEWHGVQGRSYFIEVSTDNMQTWDFLPEIRFGQEQILSMAFEKISEKMFLRLVYTDVYTLDPDVADFDGDGWTNLEEVLIYETSPFVYNATGPNGSGSGGQGSNGDGGQGGDALPTLNQFELLVTSVYTYEEGASDTTTTTRILDSGFNQVSFDGEQLPGGVPSIEVSRGIGATTTITLTDLTGDNEGAALRFLQTQMNYTENAPPTTSMVDGRSLVIGGQSSASISMSGDLEISSDDSDSQFWLLQPMDITTAFGIGPTDGNSRNLFLGDLNARLLSEPDATFNDGRIWGRKGWIRPTEEQVEAAAENGITLEPVERFFAIELVESQDPLDRALQSKNRTVVFDGHSNFGIGPNFVRSTTKRIQDFSNYGVGVTDIPSDFRGIDGAMVDPAPPISDSVTGLVKYRLDSEGWAYVVQEINMIAGFSVPVAMQAAGDITNYRPLADLAGGPDVGQRYADRALADAIIPQRVDTNLTPEPFHWVGTRRRIDNNGFDPQYWVMIDAHGNFEENSTKGVDIPARLGYSTFFFNACSTGVDYIENFQHGEFIYTTRSCTVSLATLRFVTLFVDGRNTEFILENMNDGGLGGDDDGPEYQSHVFPQN